MSRTFIALAAAVMTVATPSHGQASSTVSAPKTANSEEGEQWSFKTSYGSWGIICNQSDPGECRAIQNLTYANGENGKGRLLQLVVSASRGKTVLFAKFPLGVDLRAGTALMVGKVDEIKGVYVTCMPDGCQSFFELTPAHLAEMQTAKAMKIGFRPISLGNKTVVLESSLERFNEVLSALNAGGRAQGN